MEVAANEGYWVCLKNLHLAIDFLPDLEREMDRISNSYHTNFRLWFTTEKNDSIPSSLIERSFKIVVETPTGLKANIKQTFARWEELSLVTTGVNSSEKAKLYFVLAWIHAVIQERGSFGPQGWRQPYEFTSGDLLAAESTIEAFHDSFNVVEIVQFFLLHFIYGGKISDCSDESVLKTYVEKMFCEDILHGNADLFPGFRVNQTWDDQSHHRAIRQIPPNVTPSFFGLPCNIYRSVNAAISVSIRTKLRKLVSNTCDNGTHRTDWRELVQPITQHWKTLAHTDIKDIPMKTWPDDKLEQFIQTEILLGQCLYNTVSLSMDLLLKVARDKIDSESVLFNQLRDSFVNGQVPMVWEELWSGPSIPISWITEMIRKMKALDQYYQIFSDISILRQTIKLSDFFNPSAFICAMKQKFVREKHCSMDQVTVFAQFESLHVEQDTADRGNISIKICGLFLRGCVINETLDGNITARSVDRNSSEYQISPSIRLNFVETSTFHLTMTTKQMETILIPVYSNVLSHDKLFQVSVKCEKSAAFSVVLGAIALYLEC